MFCAGAVSNAFVPGIATPRQHIQTSKHGRIRSYGSYLSHSGPLCMTASQSSSRPPTSSNTRVVFQKILKPPSSNVPSALFLAHLVEYLQDRFELPTNLPMVYEKQQDTSDEYVLSWDSPLSSSSSETRLNVQVVAIYTDEQDDNGAKEKSLPSMAMVVVNKDDTTGGANANTLIPMMKNLFDESEKQILRALDRGLDDVQQGKIQFSDTKATTQSKSIPKNVQSVDEAIDAEIVAEQEEAVANPSLSNDNVVVDTTATSVNDKPKRIATPPRSSSEDFAVAAAKKAAAKKAKRNGTKQPESGGGDFAVEAAKRAASARNGVTSAKQKKNERPVVKRTSPTRPKRFTISTPKQRAERAAKKQAKQTVAAKAKLSDRKNTKGTRQQDSKTTPSNPVATNEGSMSKESTKGLNNTRSLNLRVEGADSSVTDDKPLEFETLQETKDGERTVSQAQMERDILEAAQKAMSEIEDVEMTPEELLQDVMKFGEEKEQENAAGSGFVSGAFEKAKELLQQQKQQRDERIREVGVKERTTGGSKNDGTLSAEEELKRIFEAGERLADGRIEISKSEEPGSDMTEVELKEQEEIDSLIAGEKTVSDYARSLDDELAELEVRINKSPGEELDGPQKNPRFDIFSGPEVYNRNVDPETAVNWPGAQPGTKDLRLPKELAEAVKQAEFAAEVMTKMKEVEQADGSSKFFLGDRELKQHQVNNVRTVVTEAVEIGLIQDPLEYLSERSRMQMVVDELSGQPEERYRDIVSNFRDLLLSENFVPLIKERLEAMADRDLEARRRDDNSLEADHAQERKILGHLVEYAQLLLKEARALGAELEASQLEIVRSICQVAMNPSHKTEEDTANALTDAVRDMRPLLDDIFVAYLKYAIAEEEGRLARAGLLDDPDHNEWLFVLNIVQQGVYSELSRGINRYIEHIMYILRMETKAERRMLLSKIIDNMPTMDVRPFVQVVDKIVASVGDSARGEFDGFVLGEMTNKILQLRRDVKELLPPERIQLMSRDADEWAAKQKQRLLDERRITKQRLKAAQEYDDEELQRRGEMERF